MTCFNIQQCCLRKRFSKLNIKSDGIYVDCTLGGAGTANIYFQELSSQGKLYSFDQDETAIQNAKEKLRQYGNQVTLIQVTLNI